MKKIVLAILFLVVIFVGSTLLNSGGNSNSKNKSTKENTSGNNYESNKKTGNEFKNYSSYSDPVIDYIEIMKSGNSDAPYFDRLESIRKILTVELFESLMPEMSDETKEEIRSEKKESDESYSSNTSNYEVSYSLTDSNEQDVFVIYTYKSFTGNGINENRYLFHAKVKQYDSGYLITNIVEDSQLMEGVYSKVK